MVATVESLARVALSQPDRVRRALDKIESETRLRDYIPVVWDVIEPGRPLVGGWCLDALCEHYEAVTDGQITRLVVNIPPGCMKSLLQNVLWPTWEWGPRNRPHLRYINASYAQKLAVRDNRKSRLIVESDTYRELWGDRVEIVSDSNAKERFDTSATGFRMATSITGIGTGERGDRFLIDDPHNVKQSESQAMRESALDWFATTVPSRINDGETSAIIVIMQRVHDRDVSGLILKEELGYEWLCLPMEYEERHRCFTSVPREGCIPEKVTRFRREGDPVPRWLTEVEWKEEVESDNGDSIVTKADFQLLYSQDRRSREGELLWSERFTRRHLDEDLKPQLRSWGGTYAEAGQLQQRPAPREGGMFQRKDFLIEDRLPDGGYWVRGWDLAASKDGHAAYTVGVKMGVVNGQIWIADVRRERASPAAVEELLETTTRQDGKTVEQSIPQDPGQAGKYQKAAIARRLHGCNFHFSPESGSKADRAMGLAAQAQAGNLYLARGSWNDAFISEACLFPNGEFLDQIDAASRAYGRLISKRPKRALSVPVLIGG